MKAVAQKKPDGGNHQALSVISGKHGEYNTNPHIVSIDIRIEVSRPRCNHCGEEMQETLFYRGGRGYGWSWRCPDWCSTDKGAEPEVIDLPPCEGGKTA